MEDNILKGRKEIRINKDLKISFRKATSENEKFSENLAIDISRSGLFIKTNQIYPLDTELEIKLLLEPEEDPIQFTALVSRVVSDSAGELSGLGIKIKNMGTDDHQRFEGFINLLNYYGWFC